MGGRTSRTRRRRWPWVAGAAAVVLAAAGTAPVWAAPSQNAVITGVRAAVPASAARTATPIKHLVVIFGENVSYDHYFGTYPKATNADGTKFTARPGTPHADGLSAKLLKHNPNAYNPRRLAPSQAMTCDQDHSYGPEQKALNGGKMDKVVENTSTDTCTGQPILFGEPGLAMDYYDGNTVTGLWNYAQHYAMSDNSFDTVFGPSTPGALNLISGQTHGAYAVNPVTHEKVSDSYAVQSPDKNGVGTVTNDPDPAYDDCSDTNHTAKNNLAVLTGPNIGDRLNARHLTWGWFQGGFRPTGKANGYAVCGAAHANVGGNSVVDYSPHHEPFQYYKSTSNPQHLAPTSAKAIGHTDRANHQYDLADFDSALAARNLPAVSFLKAAEYQDGHAGYSDPTDEQHFLVNTINKLQKSPEWKSTAVVLAYDDSDGWYDHKAPPKANGSTDKALDTSWCGTAPASGGYQDRCGYGPRLPLLAISPYSKVNHVDHHVTDQSSITRFVEDNWHTARIGDHSFGARAGSLTGLFDFRHPRAGKLLLDQNGAVANP